MADTRPLRNPYFRRLWVANIVTVVGAQLTVVAVPAQIYVQTGSSAYVGLTGVFGLVPLVVFGLWGGALADVVDRRTLLVITTCGLIVTSTLFWLQAWAGDTNVWLLLSLFSVQQAFFAVNQPTRSAVLPRLLPLLEATELYDEEFSNQLHEFSETLLHHLDEEERDILNPAREDVSEQDRVQLGAAWLAERNRMLDAGCGSAEQVRALVDDA